MRIGTDEAAVRRHVHRDSSPENGRYFETVDVGIVEHIQV